MNEKWFFILSCSFSILFSQSSVFESEPGYIHITSDSSTVPIYIDGNLIGHTPIDNPVPVMEGVHFIGFHPTTFIDPFISYGNIDTDKQIFVLSGDTVRVLLNTFFTQSPASAVLQPLFKSDSSRGPPSPSANL